MPNPAAACRIAVIANQSSGTARPDRLEAAVHLEQGGATRWETIRMTRVAPADEG